MAYHIFKLKETRVPRENYWPTLGPRQLFHMPWAGFAPEIFRETASCHLGLKTTLANGEVKDCHSVIHISLSVVLAEKASQEAVVVIG